MHGDTLFYTLAISAESDTDLQSKIYHLIESLQSQPVDNLQQISHDQKTCDKLSKFRIAVSGRSKDELVSKLTSAQSRVSKHNQPTSKLCFMFTGQGAQYPGMGDGLYEKFSVYRQHFDHCKTFLQHRYGLNLSQLPQKNISDCSTFLQDAYSLLPTLCLQYSLFKLWEFWGIKPDLILTHSLGEYAAAVQSGMMSIETTLVLVTEGCRRFQLLLRDTRMLVVWSKDKKNVMGINNEKDYNLELAVINTRSQLVYAGKAKDIEKFKALCEDQNLQCRTIPSSNPYHTPMMAPVYNHCINFSTKLQIPEDEHEPKIPYVSGVAGRKLKAGEITAKYWCDYLVNPVQFLAASQEVLAEGYDMFVEIGPRPVLSTFVRENNVDLGSEGRQEISCFPSLKPNSEDWIVISDSLCQLYTAGYSVDWQKFYESLQF
jgi:acyl transferase domain-containing protein